MTSSAHLLQQLDATYPDVLPVFPARRYLLASSNDWLTRAEALTRLQQSIGQGFTPEFFYNETTGYLWLSIDPTTKLRPMTLHDSTEYPHTLPPTNRGQHTVAAWLAQHTSAPALRLRSQNQLWALDGPTATAYPLAQVEQIIDGEYQQEAPFVAYDRLTLYVGWDELQILQLSTPSLPPTTQNVSNPVESSPNPSDSAPTPHRAPSTAQELLPNKEPHIAHAMSQLSRGKNEEVLAGDVQQGWLGKKPALTLAWDAVDEGNSGRGAVTGPSLSALLSAFDPPLPTDVQKPLLIGLGGYKESGKDALADHLAVVHDFFKLGMSAPVAEVGRRQNPWILLDRDVLCGVHLYAQGTWVKLNVLTEWLGYDESKTIREVREYYQTLGTEVGRDFFGEDTWVELAREKINSVRDAGQAVALTGIRFRNELELLKRLGGHSVWISRPGKEAEGHASESSLTKEDFDFVVDNDRDLETLYRRGSGLLQHMG